MVVAGTLQVYHYCPKVDDRVVTDLTFGDIDFDETPTRVEVICSECEKIHIVEIEE